MLSRLLITGKIDISTPLCIVSEIADAHGINYNEDEFKNEQYIQELIEAINCNETILIEFPINNIDHWGHLARFINKSVLWPQNLLVDAYNKHHNQQQTYRDQILCALILYSHRDYP